MEKVMKLLAEAFTEGKISELEPYIAEDCLYVSEYADVSVRGSEKIIERMQDVYYNQKSEGAYTYKMVQLDDYSSCKIAELELPYGKIPCETGFLLYHHNREKPVAIVACDFDEKCRLSGIWLCRSEKIFNIDFYGTVDKEDSVLDTPATVEPYDSLGHRSSRQLNPVLYIWRNADEYAINWLEEKGFYVRKSAIFKDCIAYRCRRNDEEYTVFMYAFGQKKTTELSAEFCSKLLKESFANNSKVLILYLHVERLLFGEKEEYRVASYRDDTPQLWEVSNALGKWTLNYFFVPELNRAIERFVYAFNNEDEQAFECILDDTFELANAEKDGWVWYNEKARETLRTFHCLHGELKLGYIRDREGIYRKTAHFKEFGKVYITICGGKITKIERCPFEGEQEIIGIPCDIDEVFADTPLLTGAQVLPADKAEFYAVLLRFGDMKRKFILPHKGRYHFTPDVWNSLQLCPEGICFSNGRKIGYKRLFIDSTPYIEPELTDEIVYEDEKYRVRKLWQCAGGHIYHHAAPDLVCIRVNYECIPVTVAGERVSTLTLEDFDGWDECAKVKVANWGYGHMTPEGRLMYAPQYDDVTWFHEGRAIAREDDFRYVIGENGERVHFKKQYKKVEEGFCDHRCAVSTMELGWQNLAYHCDEAEIAGLWGYIDEKGEEVIPPRYIFAHSFCDGVAIVAKGEWEKKHWESDREAWWSEEMLWGGIDTEGNEVIPFVFDLIEHFEGDIDYYRAHYGGWENGKWGVIDKCGNWVAPPQFDDLDYTCKDGLFGFYLEDKWEDDALMGIYDIRKGEVLFEPQFEDVTYLENGDILLRVYDEKLEESIAKIVDRNKNERFKSEYTSILTIFEPYYAEKDGKYGLIEADGSVVLPCEYPADWRGFHMDKKRVVFDEGKKHGIMDFDKNVIVPPIYHQIAGYDAPLFSVQTDRENGYQWGLLTPDGEVVLPVEYEILRWCKDNRHFYSLKRGMCEMFVVEEK